MPSESEQPTQLKIEPKQAPRKPYQVTIELEAVMDYISMLRGMTAYGNFYQGFNSDQLTRFPAFDGKEWDELLPIGEDFQTFFSQAASGDEGLFKRVRLYNQAQRNLSLLLKRGTHFTLIVPENFATYIPEISQWLESRFPRIDTKNQFEIETTSTVNYDNGSNIWVVRTPEAAKRLTDQGTPFILIDGKENAQIDSAVRAIGWHQAGFLLRHAQTIDWIVNARSRTSPTASNPADSSDSPLLEIWSGYEVVSIPVDETLAALSSQRKSLLLVKNNPDTYLRFDSKKEDKDGPRKPYPPELAKKVLRVIETDLIEVERQINVLREMSKEQFEATISNPDWASKVNERETKMSSQIGTAVKAPRPANRSLKSSRQKRSVPADLTGKDIATRILNGKPEVPITLRLSGSDVIHTLADNWGVVLLETYEGSSDNIAGHLGELVTLLLVKQAGWKLLLPKNAANGKGLLEEVSRRLPKFMRHPGQEVSRASEFCRVQVSWNDLKTNEPKSAEVDFIAKGPGNFYVIGEVKLTSQSELSESQKDLRDHIANGGRIDSSDLPGMRYKTFKPQWREIHIDDGPSRNAIVDLTTKTAPTPELHKSISRS